MEHYFGCVDCNIKLGVDEAVGVEMRCPNCDPILSPLDESWVAGTIEQANGKSDALLPREGFVGSQAHSAIRVARVLLPSVNNTDADGIVQFFASLPLPVSVEYLGAGDDRLMLVRGDESTLSYLSGQMSATWPRSSLEILDDDPVATGDVSVRGYGFWIGAKAAPYLPLKTWESYLRGDPVLGVFASLLGLGENEKVWIQFHLGRSATPSWLPIIQRRLKTESQRGYLVLEDGQTIGQPTLSPMPQQSPSYTKAGITVFAMILGGVGLLLGFIGKWLLAISAVLLALIIGGFVMRLLSNRDDDWLGADLNLVRKKVVQQDTFIQAVGRLTVWSASPERAQELVRRCLASMTQYSLSGGNALVITGEASQDPTWLGNLRFSEENSLWLTPEETAGLWHPPIVGEGIAPGLVPVREVEMRTPAVEDVAEGYLIGSAFKPTGGKRMDVRISKRARERGVFLIGKTGTGKSTVMEHLVKAAVEDEEKPAIVVIDPHGDMADRLLGLLGQDAADRIVYMNMGDDRYALTFNPLDPHTAQMSVDDIVSTFIDIGQALWTDFWGPRMQMPLQRTLTALVAANMLREPGDLLGPALISTLLESDNEQIQRFIETNLAGSPHYKYVVRYFYGSFVKIGRSLREQIIQPVLSKGYRFQDPPMFHLLSAPETKLNFRDILVNRKILIVNTRQSTKGRDLSAFMGALIVNWIIRMTALQGESDVVERVPLFLMMDEFQSIKGVPWDVLLGQMRKYGMQVVLGTQNFASLRNEQGSDLPGIILGGVRTIMAFEVNGEDAEKLANEELGARAGGPSADSLINLEQYTTYMKTVTNGGRRVPSFLLHTAAPLYYDEGLAGRVRDARSEYSVPVVTAKQGAEKNYDAVFGNVSLVSEGAGSGRSAAKEKAAAQDFGEAASILLGGSGELVDHSDIVGMPMSPADAGTSVEGGGGAENDILLGSAKTEMPNDVEGDIEAELSRLFDNMLGGDDDEK